MFSTWLRDGPRLRRALRWINIGGALLVAWCFYQIFVIIALDSQYPPLAARLRNLFVYQFFTVQLSGRVSGLAYEPSWFTHQLLVLYFPLWMAAAYQRRSAFGFRLWKISLEVILLVVGLAAFWMASPRVSMLALVLVLAYLVIRAASALFRRIVALITRRWQHARLARLAAALALLLLFILSFGLGIWGILQAGSQRDWRLALITESQLTPQEWRVITRFDEDSLLYLGMKFAFLERVTYWVTGWHVFNDYPLFGVGLGNAGFFMTERLPAVGWGTFEVRALVYRAASLLNTKSLWVRLLAETGLVGFALFASWLWVLWRSAAAAESRREPLLHLVGLAGKIALVAMLVEGFSIDSFAMPYFWIIAGIITAARRISTPQTTQQASLPAAEGPIGDAA
jgi:hypothetical protein